MSDYERERIPEYLEAVWDLEWTDPRSPRAIREEGRQSHTHGHTAGDGMGRVVVAADVRRSWARLDKDEKQILEARHYREWGLDTITQVFGLEDVQEAADLVDGAEGRLIDILNGQG